MEWINPLKNLKLAYHCAFKIIHPTSVISNINLTHLLPSEVLLILFLSKVYKGILFNCLIGISILNMIFTRHSVDFRLSVDLLCISN